MKKDLLIKKDTPLSIVKTKALLDLTQKILGESGVDSGWAERLWAWADENGIPSRIVPRDLDSLIQLTKLDLSGQSLSVLPKELEFLARLTELNLGFCQIAELPNEIGRLTQLTELYLSGNRFADLPEGVVNLKKLKRLWLNDSIVLSCRQSEWIHDLSFVNCDINLTPY